MRYPTLMTFTAATLMVAGSAFACPKKDKGKTTDEDTQASQQEVFFVVSQDEKPEREKKQCKGRKTVQGEQDGERYTAAEKEGGKKARKPKDGESKSDRSEKGEKGDRPHKGKHMVKLDLTEDQQAQIDTIREEGKAQAMAIIEGVKAKREAGEEVDRESVREQLMAIRKSSREKVYNTVLNDEQRAKVDAHRAKMEQRRSERESEEGDRPKGKNKGEGKGKGDGERPSKKGGGDEGLDL